MECFFVDGKIKPLSTILAGIAGEEIVISTFGINKNEVFKLFPHFKKITVIVDSKIKKRNDGKHLDILIKFSKRSKKLHVKTLGVSHHKVCIIDGQTAVFTSANLQKNRSEEFYLIGKVTEIDGANEIVERLQQAGDF